jgi:hypothetical protein
MTNFRGDRSWRCFLAVAHQQDSVRVIQIVAWIRAVAAVGQQLDLARLARLKTDEHPS